MYTFEEKYRRHLFLIFPFDLTGICRDVNKEGRVLPPPRAAETKGWWNWEKENDYCIWTNQISCVK